MKQASIDPALTAIAAFVDCKAGFERWLDQDQSGFIDQDEVDRQEADWMQDHETKLAEAAAAVPTTVAGLRAFAALFDREHENNAQPAVLEAAWRSVTAALATLPAGEWSAS